MPAEALADFRSVVVILAESAGSGRLTAHTVAALDACGRPRLADRPWPPATARKTICLVHLLAATDTERLAVVADLAAVPMQLAA